MILLERVHYFILLALMTFLVLMYLKLFMNTRSVRYSLKGILYFIVISMSFPIALSNYIYSQRDQIIEKANSNTYLTGEQRERIKKVLNSKVRIHIRSARNFILKFPLFIEAYSMAYKSHYLKNKHKFKSKTNTLSEIKRGIFGRYEESLNASLGENI